MFRAAFILLGRLLKSRPNTYVRPQKVSSISVIFGMYMEVNELCTILCSMIQSKVKVMSLQSWKSGHF